MPGWLKDFPGVADKLGMTSTATATAPSATRGRRGPLFAAVERAALEGVSRRSFAVKTGLTSAEVWMLERATGVRLAV
jgi:hypothetical protein